MVAQIRDSRVLVASLAESISKSIFERYALHSHGTEHN